MKIKQEIKWINKRILSFFLFLILPCSNNGAPAQQPKKLKNYGSPNLKKNENKNLFCIKKKSTTTTAAIKPKPSYCCVRPVSCFVPNTNSHDLFRGKPAAKKVLNAYRIFRVVALYWCPMMNMQLTL